MIRKAGFKGSYQYACVLCAASTLLLAGLLFQTVAFAVLNTVVPLWMEQSDAATWEAGLVGAFFFLGNLAGKRLSGMF